ncbi:hypothetical protein MNO14_14350 [Luteimonas sp. S4-F44]|uniref:hypothetical protein n=1 Tax=Luteimonas sp. S4-F44 TaxID=2925842 RepID=UPI001F5395F9|nr:hypothetical protein [Luteimonas sp. S4-F44]UNK42110.1 hypothetical protein MNO14_14350 [Luteimonas sp. S4-F44]
MNIKILYRVCLIVLAVGQVIWFFFPWGLLYGENLEAAAYFDGADSAISGDWLKVISEILFVMYMLTYAGLYFFKRWARIILVSLLIFGCVLIYLSGAYVQSGYEAAFGFLLTIGDGFLVGTSFFSSVARDFYKV